MISYSKHISTDIEINSVAFKFIISDRVECTDLVFFSWSWMVMVSHGTSRYIKNMMYMSATFCSAKQPLKKEAQSGMSCRRHLSKYGAFGGFLRCKDARSVAQASKSHQESFANGDFLLHLRLETNQMSRILQKVRIARDEALRRMLDGLNRFPKSPLLSLQILEPGTFGDLYPLILQVLRVSTKLQTLFLHDISINPIRAESAAGQFHEEQCLQLTELWPKSGQDLKHLSITAGTWTWESLCILFRSLEGSGTLKRLRLRGKLTDTGLLSGAHFSFRSELAALKVCEFSWQGSRIYDASILERLFLALPLAQLSFRPEMTGCFRGPTASEIEAFEQLALCRSIQVATDRGFVDLEPGVGSNVW